MIARAGADDIDRLYVSVLELPDELGADASALVDDVVEDRRRLVDVVEHDACHLENSKDCADDAESDEAEHNVGRLDALLDEAEACEREAQGKN